MFPILASGPQFLLCSHFNMQITTKPMNTNPAKWEYPVKLGLVIWSQTAFLVQIAPWNDDTSKWTLLTPSLGCPYFTGFVSRLPPKGPWGPVLWESISISVFMWTFFFQATLLSSHRLFVSRIDVVELSDTLAHRGDPLSIFVFTDYLEVTTVQIT
jgi:hypothetical protein